MCSTPQQPGLRSFIIYDDLPAGCIAFQVPDDSSAPHLHAGEFVVIDPADRDPAEGELFAITWKSNIQQDWQIVQMDLREGRYGRNGMMRNDTMWFVGAPAPQAMMSLAGRPVGPALRRCSGPYDDDYLRDIAHGRIIGLFQSPYPQLTEVVR
ncbi:S24/S26 family peptidase [uncultured Sphingomonas sp.]|uniref:S24/S26 family peptidase n=1 Tax=uncultured Sphingomonas sp. TaxID=158754 RepID=UPI0026324FA6|nr:S24/S26 family peptidase [uncultured Sphingomonas sp.]